MLSRISSSLAELEYKPRYEYLALGLITLLAAFLRFYKLGEWSFWIDEIYTIRHAKAHFSSLELIIRNIPPNRNWIPLSVILTAGTLNALGTSEWSARLVSATIGVISVPVLYLPVRRLFSPGVALITALLLAVSPWHIYWSQNARFLTSLMLLYSLALFALFFGLERDRPGYILLSIVLFYLAASERLYAAFLVPVVVGYVLFLRLFRFKTPPGLRARNLLLLTLPIIAAGIVEVYSLITGGVSRFFGDFIFLGNSIENPFAQGTFIVFEIGIPLVTLSAFTGLYLLLQKSRAGLLLSLGAAIPFAMVVLATPFMFTEERFALVTLPFWLVLGATGVKEMFSQTAHRGKLLVAGVLILLLADAAGANLMYYRVNNGNRRDYKGAFALVRERSREDDIIVSTWPELGAYYLHQETIPWRDIDLDTVVQSGERVWFVIVPDMAWYWKNPDAYWWVVENGELVEVRYLRRLDDASLFIYLYDPG